MVENFSFLIGCDNLRRMPDELIPVVVFSISRISFSMKYLLWCEPTPRIPQAIDSLSIGDAA